MDFRNPHHSSYPHQNNNESRPAPIPPPPYSRGFQPLSPHEHSGSRATPSYENGRDLPYNPDRGDVSIDMNMASPSLSIGGPFGVATYGQHAAPEGPNHSRPLAKGDTWPPLGSKQEDRFRHHTVDAPSSLPPPPPPIASNSNTYGPSRESYYLLEDPARQAGPRSSSPKMLGGPQTSLPPPPPPSQSYGNRAMPPPSPPQYSSQAGQARETPQQSPNAGSRDLPALPTAPRPNGSMSISSMLGSDPGRPPREPSAPSHFNGSSSAGMFQPLSHYQSSAGSPVKQSGTFSTDQDFSRSQNPVGGSVNRPFRAYSGESVRPHKDSPPSNQPFRYGPSPQESPALAQISPRSTVQERLPEQNRHPSISRFVDGPNSQPSPYNSSPLDFEKKSREIDMRRSELARQEAELGPTNFGSRGRNSNPDGIRKPGRQEKSGESVLISPSTVQKTTKEERVHSAYPFVAQTPMTTGSSAKSDAEFRSHRTSERDFEPRNQAQKSPFDADALKRLRAERLGPASAPPGQETGQDAIHPRMRSFHHPDERRSPADTRQLLSAQSMDRSRSSDSGIPHRSSDDLSAHRSSLAAILDNNRRGRLSPLPQAVQGAQSRADGPSRDPSIKNEFSRMFAGIGSGVSSSGLAGSGASTPFPPSPRQSVDRDQRLGSVAHKDGTADSRSASTQGRKRNKMRDEESRERDGGENRASATLGARALKKNKHSHRHVPHSHHHHHHHEDHTPLRTVNNQSSPTPVPHHHHHRRHHHHDGSLHHHHSHTSKPGSAAAITREKTPPAPRLPSIIINNDPILSTVKSLSRRHLGTVVYAPNVDPASSNESSRTKLSYATGQYSIPRCDGKENCTLTVRVPRFYLTHDELLHTCARRAVWGTDVYTDDSDPLCALVHAGWIRGAWPPEVDVSMLEPDLRHVTLAADAVDWRDTVLEEPPSQSPMIPPPNKDLHITLVILPALQSYTSRIAHGVKSRAWGSDHDGLSFRIQKIAWVNEGEPTAEERTAKVRKRRVERLGLGLPEGLIRRQGSASGSASTTTSALGPSPPVQLTAKGSKAKATNAVTAAAATAKVATAAA